MSSFLFSAAKAVGNIAQFVQDSNAPVDQDGARPIPAFLKQEVEDIHQVVTRGAAFHISDLVRCVEHARVLVPSWRDLP